MSENQELNKALLQQMNGIESKSSMDIYLTEIQRNIKKEQRRSCFLKWLTILWWTVTAIIHITYMSNVGSLFQHPDRIDNSFWTIYNYGIFEPFMILAGVVITMVFLMRSKTVSLLEIQVRLASMEEQIKRLGR